MSQICHAHRWLKIFLFHILKNVASPPALPRREGADSTVEDCR